MRMSYEERQEKWIARNCVKIGDRVRVLQKYEPKTCGDWVGAFWIDQMNIYVKKTGKIVGIEECGIQVDFGDDPIVKYWFPYSVLRKKKKVEKSYIERQAEWVKENGIKKDDEVRLIRKASTREDGWRNVWPDKANEWVGKILKVKEISEMGIACYIPETRDWFGLPYFVLEKVMEHKDKEWTVSYGLKVKTGDPVLMRDNELRPWTYSVFSHKRSRGDTPYPYYSAGIISAFCIPYKGNEHLVGTTDDYKAPEKPTKPKFVFGAKVKALLSSGEEMEGILIGIDTGNRYTPFEVAVQDEDGEFGRIRYWAESVTYID